ncbi:hypothetical protein WC39_08295 [Mannheimia haemolytica]|nr:hypothetical protein WC39_08295 [Mannheimia haemolytica]AKA14268.1 hypothetical protein VK67_08295 [Mannheimia haemolytica]EPZ23624.1 hypothetical protein L277_04410 [Mannheimia haemolytica D193]
MSEKRNITFGEAVIAASNFKLLFNLMLNNYFTVDFNTKLHFYECHHLILNSKGIFFVKVRGLSPYL